MEPYYLKCIMDGPFQPKPADGDTKPESQWTPNERKVVIQHQHLKGIIMSLRYQENRIIDLKLEFQTFKAKSTKSLSQTYTCYKNLLNELANDGVNVSKHEINVGLVNILPEKWLTYSQGLRNANHTQNLDLADIYERFIYEDNLIQRRYSDTKKALITTPSSTLISTAFFSNKVIQNFQENSDDEVDESSSEGFSAGTSTEQVNSIQKLLTYSLITEVDIKEIIYSVSSARTEVDIREIIYSDLVTKLLNKSRLKYVSYPRFISCALQVLLGFDYTQDEKFRDLTSTTFDEGTAKTTSRPKGSLGDKDSGGNTPSTDMKPIHPIVAGQSGIGAKYQVDQTQSTRLRYQSLPKNKGKPSHEGELDTQPLVLSTYADVRAFLLSDDEAQESKEDILRAEKPQSSHAPYTEASDNDSSCDDILKKYNNTLPLTERQLVKLLGLERAQNHIKSSMSSLKDDTHSIKTMMTEMYEVFKVQSSGSVTPTLPLTHIPANVEGENATNTATEEPPSHTEGETDNLKMAIPISSIHPTKVPPTQAQPITTITTHPKSSQIALRIDKGKGIATESDPSKKLVPASTIVRLAPDEEAKVPYMINGKMCYLTDKEMQAYLGKEEKLRKAAEEERLLSISKPEVIKVVQEEAEKIRLDPKKIANTKADELREIIPKKKNTVVQDLMTSLSRMYERIRKILEELGIKSALPAPDPEQSSRKKRKHMELEPEIKIPGLECN
uniref:Retrovirus-related Pol polyprotein from transposon TNT 1-94 n=1 Tax=Tanacetum cinerariifolium TaxID=118510 RepID=A0A699IES3_TANCI|nr:retrovirus-related Pol polyprotein from transposon TNT 1-94 [Tanacetum cinerariifolium]